MKQNCCFFIMKMIKLSTVFVIYINNVSVHNTYTNTFIYIHADKHVEHILKKSISIKRTLSF